MKVTFYSNFLNHHQLPFCEAMIEQIGDGFTFVATKPIPCERISMGYMDMNNNYSFVLRAYESQDEHEKAKCLAVESDVIIHGSAPIEYLDMRMKQNRLTFKYKERLFKKGSFRRFIPTTRMKIYNGFIKYKGLNFHVLCASAYTAYDLSLCGMRNNTYKWGYFPKVKEQNLGMLMKKKNINVMKMLWVGRLIGWKRAKDAVEVVKRLKINGYTVYLDIIGTGDEEERLEGLVKHYDLQETVSFLGSISPEEVREHMEDANIYLFTSDFQEGWGAVLNEAMNSGCAVVASHAIGSVPYLLEYGKNGLLYKFGDNDDFFNKVKYLLDNPKKQKEFGEAAYKTLSKMWNAEVAAERLINISQQLLNGKKFPYYNIGPCSPANIIKNNWFKRRK